MNKQWPYSTEDEEYDLCQPPIPELRTDVSCMEPKIEVLWGNVAGALGARMYAAVDEKMVEEP